MLEFRNTLQATKTPYALHAEQLHNKFSLCFNTLTTNVVANNHKKLNVLISQLTWF